MYRRAIVASVLALVALIAGSASAAVVAHLRLDRSIPEADQVLQRSPDKIVLDFSQRPELSVSRVVVKGEQRDGRLTDLARSEEDDSVLWAALEEPLPDGSYSVSWLTSSGDGHPVRGEFSFVVRSGR